MSALAKIQSPTPLLTSEQSMLDGAGVELFTNSLGPQAGDMGSGAGLELFTNSLGPDAGDMRSGAGLELFTTSC